MQRTREDKIELIYKYGQSGQNLHETERLFNEAHPDRPVCRKYVRELIHKFNTTGSVNTHKGIRGPKAKTTEEVQVGVLGEFVVDPHLSVRTASLSVGLSKSTVHRVLKQKKFMLTKLNFTKS